jgi:phospholipid transport system substrate-binding protein
MLPLPRRRALTAVALAATLEIVACPAANAGAPTERLREFFAKVNTVLADPATEDRPLERVARIRRLVAEIGDVDGAAAAALGAEWDTKTPAQRDEFITLFADVIERAYVARFAGAVRSAGGLAMAYRDEVVTGSEATVTASVRHRGSHDLRVEYRMVLRGGRWRVRDIVVDGVSTVGNYRAQFRRLLRDGSYVAVVAQMREKLMAESLMFASSEPRRTTAGAPPPEARPAEPTADAAVAPPPPPVVQARPPARVRVERTAPPAPATVAAVVKSAAAARPSAPVKLGPPAPVPVVAGPTSISEPAAIGTMLGALLIGLVGVGGATLLRRRASARRAHRVLS